MENSLICTVTLRVFQKKKRVFHSSGVQLRIYGVQSTVFATRDKTEERLTHFTRGLHKINMYS